MPEQEQTMVASQPTEVSVLDPVRPTVPDVSLDPMDFQKEIAKIAKEQGMEIKDGNVVESVKPDASQEQTQTQATSQPQPQAEVQPNVPEKFQTKDGGVDLDKVQKSTVNAVEALKKYQDLEVELRRKQSEVAQLKNAPSLPQASQTQIQVQVPQITAEQINAALSQSNNPGKVLLDLLAVRDQAVYAQASQQAREEIEPLKNRVEAAQRQTELQKIADRDPWVFSEEGIKELGARRQAKPWLNMAPEPWAEAYKDYVADREMQKSFSQVQTPTPTPLTVKAPATPVNGGNRTQVLAPTLAQLSQNPQALNKYVDSLPNQAAKDAFWKVALPGLRGLK